MENQENKNIVINSFMVELEKKQTLTNEQLKDIQITLKLVMADYSLEKISRELMPYIDFFYIERFIVSKKIEGKSMTTLKLYLWSLKTFFLAVQMPVDKIKTDIIRVYLYNYQKEHKITNRTLDNMRRVLLSFFTWCVREEIIEKNPMEKILPIKYTVEPRQPIDPLDLERIRDACIELRDKALIEFLFSTGARVSEVVSVNINDINFLDKSVIVLGKGSKYRTVFLNPKAEFAILKYLKSRNDNDPALFVSLRNPHHRLSVRGIQRIIQLLVEKAGINKKITPHSFRHTFATVGLQNGLTAPEVQKLLGHDKLDTTMIYTKIDNDALKIKTRKLIV